MMSTNISPIVLEAACKAHWTSWGKMRPDNERKWKSKMEAALNAGFAAYPGQLLSQEALVAACKAHWPSWNQMRPDHQREWFEKMKSALDAAASAQANLSRLYRRP